MQVITARHMIRDPSATDRVIESVRQLRLRQAFAGLMFGGLGGNARLLAAFDPELLGQIDAITAPAGPAPRYGCDALLPRIILGRATLVRPRTAFGLGGSLTPDLPGGETAFMHTGSDPGVRALAVGLADSRRGLVILSNSDNAMPAWSGIISEMWGETGEALVSRARE